MFLKNTQNCPNYSLIGIVSSSPYFENLFTSLKISEPSILIFYLYKQKIVEDELRVELSKVKKFISKYEKIFKEIDEEIKRAKLQNCFLIDHVLDKKIVNGIFEARERFKIDFDKEPLSSIKNHLEFFNNLEITAELEEVDKTFQLKFNAKKNKF